MSEEQTTKPSSWLRHLSETDSPINITKELVAAGTTFLAMAYITIVNPPSCRMPAWISEPSCRYLSCRSTGLNPHGIGRPAASRSCPRHGPKRILFLCHRDRHGSPMANGAWRGFISGVIFVVISIVPIREWLINSIPMNLKRAFLLASAFLLALSRCRAPALLKAMMPPWSPSPALRDQKRCSSYWVYAHHHFKCKTSLWCDHHGHPLASLLGWATGISEFGGLVSAPPSIAPVLFELDIRAALEVRLSQ